MPFIKRTGSSPQLDPKIQKKRRQIIEEERIRVLGEALMLFYDKLMEKYELVHQKDENMETEDPSLVSREEVEKLSQEYAATKPTGY